MGAKSCINTFNPSFSLTGLPRKGLATLRPHAPWGVHASKAGAAAPPGTVFRHRSGCQVSGLRHFLSWGAVSPCHTGSPRPSWKGEGRHSPPARDVSELPSLLTLPYPLTKLAHSYSSKLFGAEIVFFSCVYIFITAEAMTGLGNTVAI